MKGVPGPFFSSSHQAAPHAPLRPWSGTLPTRQSLLSSSAARRPGFVPACGSELPSVAIILFLKFEHKLEDLMIQYSYIDVLCLVVYVICL